MRIRARVALLAAVVLLCGALPACSRAPKQEVWRFAIEEIEGSVQHHYAQQMQKLLTERSQGKVKLEIYPYGALGTSAELTEQVQSGALQLAFASPGHLGSVVPEVQVFSLHFVLSDDEKADERVLASHGRFRKLLEQAMREHQLQLLALVPEGWMVWTANRPLRSPADFAGLKIRTMVSPLLVKVYDAYGANPTPMPYSEVYSGLQLHMIDAQVNPVFAVEEMSFYEVQDYLIRAKHAMFVSTVVANPSFYDSLSPERRALLDGVVADLDGYVFDLERRVNRERLEKIRAAGGTKILTLDQAQRDRLRRVSLPVRDTYVEMAGPRGRQVLDALLEEVARAERETTAEHAAPQTSGPVSPARPAQTTRTARGAQGG